MSTGSGFFIHSNGTIITNAHVVSDMGDKSTLWVTLSNGTKIAGHVHSLDLLGNGFINEADLAIIQLENPPKVKPVTFAHGRIRPGEFVIAIGSPYGLHNTVTAGVVSSRCRRHHEVGGLDSRLEFIQTDCAVHAGSSVLKILIQGGPLVNLDGHVIGNSTLIRNQYDKSRK